ncbi:YdbL family protein [Paraglaciecola psychrophila]|uniref:DUF1318 domain-containing protein n=1 Tax=Paraglaciecola psychrophila 170 TaxID=1129794 RepID=K7ACF4_9ALTE|nr:YdbL family protein [Paraglaciecola psychrophila]AGH46445.1 hypothetical protein C427_4343 [Paraglaciecola psychrophila 170]GAC38323.1 conserved hypothetical protein [Paraglaciecola psychrophila 170]
MKNIIFKTIIIVSFVFSSVVFAIDLDEAKDNGLVGEKDNGYLGLVVIQTNTQNNTPSETQLLIDDINAKRKAVYIELAVKNGITLQQVEKLAAAKAYEKTSSGHYLWMNGQWTKK